MDRYGNAFRFFAASCLAAFAIATVRADAQPQPDRDPKVVTALAMEPEIQAGN